jgi:hypothetical protein
MQTEGKVFYCTPNLILKSMKTGAGTVKQHFNPGSGKNVPAPEH